MSVTRERISHPGDLEIGKENFEKIGEIVRASILRNIQSQTQANGAPLKENAPSTRRMKELAGRPQLSLVDKLHRFVKPSNWLVSAENKRVVVEPRGDLVELCEEVQVKGYTGWFGLNRKGIELVREILRGTIKKWWESRREIR
jgi:hypothetical protein